MEKSELIKKIFDILLNSDLDTIDKLIDIYVLIDAESKHLNKLKEEAEAFDKKYKDLSKDIEEKKKRLDENDKIFKKIQKDLEDRINREKFGKNNDEVCLLERFIEKTGDKYRGQPIFLSCKCSKCNPRFIVKKYT